MATVRFALVGVCYISQEHARLSGPPHHRDALGKERFLVSCACVPKPPGRACQEGGMHPSPFWVSALFWWWWSFPGNGYWLLVALLVLHIWLADLLVRCQGFKKFDQYLTFVVYVCSRKSTDHSPHTYHCCFTVVISFWIPSLIPFCC